MTDPAAFMGQFVPDHLSVTERALAQAAINDARADTEAAKEQAAREANAQQRDETLEFANRQFGVPPGELQRQQAMFTEADDELRDLYPKVRKLERRRDRARDNIRFFAERTIGCGVQQR